MNTIFECYYMLFWLRKEPSIKYVRNSQLVGDQPNWGGGESTKMCTATYRDGGVTPHVYVRTYNVSFHVFGSVSVL